MQWQLRYIPDMPISYENQQTSEGIVLLKDESWKQDEEIYKNVKFS